MTRDNPLIGVIYLWVVAIIVLLGLAVLINDTPTDAPAACRVYEDGSATCPADTFDWDPPKENGDATSHTGGDRTLR